MTTHPLPAADPPLSGHSPLSLGGVFFALGLRYDMVLARRIRSKGHFPAPPQNLRHRLFTFFLLAASTTYVRGPLLAHNPSPILVRGPESGISEG